MVVEVVQQDRDSTADNVDATVDHRDQAIADSEVCSQSSIAVDS